MIVGDDRALVSKVDLQFFVIWNLYVLWSINQYVSFATFLLAPCLYRDGTMERGTFSVEVYQPFVMGFWANSANRKCVPFSFCSLSPYFSPRNIAGVV